MRISDWSSDVCSSDLNAARVEALLDEVEQFMLLRGQHRSFSMMTRRCRAGHRENDSGTKRNLSSDDDIVRHRPGIARGRADVADQQRIGGGEREGAPAFLADYGHEPAVFEARAEIVPARVA